MLLIERMLYVGISLESVVHPCFNDVVHNANWRIPKDTVRAMEGEGGGTSESSAK